MSRVLVTGASGFIGEAVVPHLAAAGHTVRAVVRGTLPPHLAGIDTATVADIGPDTDWSPSLSGIDVVVHLAARVHVMHETAANPDAEFHRVNAAGTRRLAEAAVVAGVNRFVLLSSVKVGGESTRLGEPLNETQPPAPEDAYGRSKAAAEQMLAAATGTSMRWIALRSPLVYGPGVGGNFRRLMRLCEAGVPLPIAAIDNARSLIGRANLADAIRGAVDVPKIASGPYYVADDEDVSTAELCRRIGRALHRPVRLFAVPPSLMWLVARLIAQQAAASRLIGSLQVDSSRFRRAVGWTPPVSMIKGLQETADWYIATVRARN